MSTKKKSNNCCCVYGCKSYYSIDTNISFHRFPSCNEPKILWTNIRGDKELVDRRKRWAIMLRFSKEALGKKQLQVCSKHFTPNDFFPQGLNRTRSRLKSTAVPSQNLPQSSVLLPTLQKRAPPKNKVSSQKQLENLETQSCEYHDMNNFDDKLDINNTSSSVELNHLFPLCELVVVNESVGK